MPEKPKTEAQPKAPTVGYRVELINASDAATVAAILNEMGADGWELIAMRQVGFARDFYIFKRSPS